MRMPDFFEDSYFSIDSIYIRLILDFVFFEYFYGNFVASDAMSSLFYFSKCSFSFGLANYETSYMFSFCVFFFFVSSFLTLTFVTFAILSFNLFFGPIVVIKRDLYCLLTVHINILVSRSFTLNLLWRLLKFFIASFFEPRGIYRLITVGSEVILLRII